MISDGVIMVINIVSRCCKVVKRVWGKGGWLLSW